MTPTQIAAAVVAASESIRAAESALETDTPRPSADTALSSLRAARAALAVLSEEVEAVLPTDDDGEPKQSTDDPSTCGHLETWDLPNGQTMCQSCGASKVGYNSWYVL